jgi:hypothetical protein
LLVAPKEIKRMSSFKRILRYHSIKNLQIHRQLLGSGDIISTIDGNHGIGRNPFIPIPIFLSFS